MRRENKYQREIIATLKEMFPGCIVVKNDANYIQGIPDIVIYWRDRYAMLEIKRSEGERPEPNQEHYIRTFNKMSFAAFIYPENEEEVLDGLQRSFST